MPLLHPDSRCFHSFRPGEGVSYTITVSPAIMGFELSEQGPGAQSKVWLFKCQGGLGTTVQAVKCVSEHDVTAAASGRAHGLSVSHQNHQPVEHSQIPCAGYLFWHRAVQRQ